MLLEPGSTLQGRYRLVALQEQGPHHERWDARILATDRPVRLHLLEAVGGRALQAGKLRFAREVRRVAELRHCCIAPIIDAGPMWDERHFVVQDGLSGETLASHIAHSGIPASRKVERLMMQALDALGAAHRLGLVHRALSMNTLVVCLGGLRRSLAIVDLGIVALLEASLDATPGSVDAVAIGMQAPKFAARGAAAAATAADVYSWALIMRELLGRHADSGRWGPVIARATAPRRRTPSVATMEAIIRGEPEPDELEPPKSDRAPSYMRIDDAEVLEERLALFTRQSQWVEAIEVLVRLSETERDGVKAAKHALAAGMLIQGELGDDDRALRYFRVALDRCADADRAFDAAEQLLVKKRAWGELNQLYRDLLTRLPTHGRTSQERNSRRFHLLMKLGKLARAELGDETTARQAFSEAVAMRADDREAREALAALDHPVKSSRRRS